MTLPEVGNMEPTDNIQNMHTTGVQNINSVLKHTLLEARDESRVTCGIYECAKLLEAAPDNVMLCVLPYKTTTEDVTLQIQHTLIEAFCWENSIRLLKVDSEEKLAMLLTSEKCCNNNEMISSSTTVNRQTDFSCVLIEHHTDTPPSPTEECVFQLYTDLMLNSEFPLVELPV